MLYQIFQRIDGVGRPNNVMKYVKGGLWSASQGLGLRLGEWQIAE
jgi:hypothetical protein